MNYKKKIKFIAFLILYLIFVFLIVRIVGKRLSYSAYNYENIPITTETQVPIETRLKAATFTKNFGDLNEQVVNESKEYLKRNIDVKWQIFVTKDKTNKNNWGTEISTKHVIPSFSCSLSFTKDGQIVRIPGYSDFCQYNK